MQLRPNSFFTALLVAPLMGSVGCADMPSQNGADGVHAGTAEDAGSLQDVAGPGAAEGSAIPARDPVPVSPQDLDDSLVRDSAGGTATVVEPAPWEPLEAIAGVPSAPTLVLGVATPTADGAMLWWLPASDDATPHAALTYEIHVGDSREFQPSDATLRLTLTGVESGTIDGLERGERVWLTVTAVDADGQRGVWDEPMEIAVPDRPLQLVEGTRVLELGDADGVVVGDGSASFPLDALPTRVVQGDVLAFSLAQVLEHERSLVRVVDARTVDGRVEVTTERVVPEQLMASGRLEPVARFFEVPDALAGDWVPDEEVGWERREALLADGIVHVAERRRAPTPMQKSCVGNWWDCVETVVPSGETCSTGDIRSATFSGGSTRFAYACHFDSGSSSSGTFCDLDSSSAQTFDAFGQDDNGRRCATGEAHFALQGQFGVGGEAVFVYDGETTRRDIGEGAAECNDGTRPGFPPCESASDRARAGSRTQSEIADDRSEVTLRPRLLGGVDVSARAAGAAGVGVTYEFFNRYKTFRPAWFLWITLGIRGEAEGSVEANGTMEAGLRSDFGNNVGLDINVIYDGSRSGDPGDPYVFSRSSPNSFGPSVRLVMGPTFEPRMSGYASARAKGTVAFYVYARLESTVYFEVGPKAELTANLGIGSPVSGLPNTCSGPPRINRFDVDFLLGPAAKFEIQWPFTGNPISLGSSTASWYWGPSSFPSLNFQRRLFNLPIWSVTRTLPINPLANIVDICPGKRGRICLDVVPQPRPAGINWSSIDWTFPSFMETRGAVDGQFCVDVFAPISAAGQQGVLRVYAEPDYLGPIAGMCGEAFYSVGTRQSGCRWIGDGVCDYPQEQCGTTDCPFGSAPCFCGDGVCDNSKGDNCGTCPVDCGACAPPITVTPGDMVRIDTTDQLRLRWNSQLGTGVRTVNLTRDFYIGTGEVSQQEYFDLMNPIYATMGHPNYANLAACRADCSPTRFPCPYACPASHDLPGTTNPCPDCPISFVNFRETIRYLNARSAAEGIPECFRISVDPVTNEFVLEGVNAPGGDVTQCVGYRLPTEAEWEYAYRNRPSQPVGSRLQYTDFHNGQNLSSLPLNLSSIAWYADAFPGSIYQAMPRRGLTPNASGLYDMSGNVWEWTWTSIDEYTGYTPAATDPGARSPAGSEDPWVVRGGSYSSPATWSVGGSDDNGGVHFIFTEDRDTESSNVGFRAVRTAW